VPAQVDAADLSSAEAVKVVDEKAAVAKAAA
jgi:hypothetical protein